MKKRMAGMLALLSAVAITVTGCSVGNTPDYSKEAINVAGVSVPLKEVNFLLRYQQTQMQSFYGMFYGEDYLNQDLMGTGAPYGNTMRDGVVEMLGDYYVVEAHAEELGISLEVPMFSVDDILSRYEVHARRDPEKGIYVIGAAPREGEGR